MKRKPLSKKLKLEVLIESGYRCSIPTCRTILTQDIHHIIPVSEGGANDKENLIALCPNCHSLYHRGIISAEAIYVYKAIITSLTNTFDLSAIDLLLFLYKIKDKSIILSGDGVIKFARIIASGLAGFICVGQNGPFILYKLFLEESGEKLIDAWNSGDIEKMEAALPIQQNENSTRDVGLCELDLSISPSIEGHTLAYKPFPLKIKIPKLSQDGKTIKEIIIQMFSKEDKDFINFDDIMTVSMKVNSQIDCWDKSIDQKCLDRFSVTIDGYEQFIGFRSRDWYDTLNLRSKIDKETDAEIVILLKK